MTYTLTCDYCSKAVANGDGFVQLTVKGKGNRQDGGDTSAEWGNGWIAHYHDGCMNTVRDMLCLIRDTGAELESIPTMKREPARANRTPVALPAPVRGELPIREHLPIYSPLQRAGIRTLEEASERTEFELLMLDGVGFGTVRRLAQVMAQNNLSFQPGADPVAVGRRLAELRSQACVSQASLASALDPGEPDRRGRIRRELSQATIAAWESGRNAPSKTWLTKLAEYFGVTCDEILD